MDNVQRWAAIISQIKQENEMLSKRSANYSEIDGMIYGRDKFADAPTIGRDALIARNLRQIYRLNSYLALHSVVGP